MARRILIGYQQVETTPMRQFRCAATGVWDRRRKPILRSRADELRPDGEGYYWCPADKPEISDDELGLWVKRIYATTKLPTDPPPRCDVCGITLAEIRDLFTGAKTPIEESGDA